MKTLDSLAEELAAHEYQLHLLASAVETLRAALGSTEADLSLLRFRAGGSIPWGTGGVPDQHKVDQTIAKARKALGYK